MVARYDEHDRLQGAITVYCAITASPGALALNLGSLRSVRDVVRISVPYKLVSSENHQDRSVVRVGGVPIGPGTLTVIARPCAVETPQQALAAAQMAKAAGASLLRGGAFKPRTSPYAFRDLVRRA